MSKDSNPPPDLCEPVKDGNTEASRPGAMSLEGMHDSVKVPHHKAGFWKQMAAYFGPAILVSVAYMDPGNWGTDLQGGAQFKYGLLWVVGLASLMAIFLQTIAARLGIATGRDLAQCCYDWYPKWTRVPNWLMAELAIIACDLAEVLGGAVALLMLFHIPIFWGVIITGVDVLLLLAMQRFGMRTIEAIVLLLVATIGSLLFHRNFRPAADAAQLSGNGPGDDRAHFDFGHHDLCGHRDHRRNGHAACAVSAPRPGAEPQIPEGRRIHAKGDPLQHLLTSSPTCRWRS